MIVQIIYLEGVALVIKPEISAGVSGRRFMISTFPEGLIVPMSVASLRDTTEISFPRAGGEPSIDATVTRTWVPACAGKSIRRCGARAISPLGVPACAGKRLRGRGKDYGGRGKEYRGLVTVKRRKLRDLHQRRRHHHRDMYRLARGTVGNLVPATGAIGNDQRFRAGGAHRRQQRQVSHRH